MKVLTGIIAFGLAITGGPACTGRHDVPPETARLPVSVDVVPVTAVDAAERLEAGGVVAAQETALLSSRLVATIAGVRARAGDRVRAGDALVVLDARDVVEHTQQARAGARAAEKAQAQARAAKSAAEAEHRLATAWRDRIIALHARHSATDQERDEAEARLVAATARLSGADAAIEGADANLGSARSALGAATAVESYTTLRAPFDGLVTERLTDPGNLAAPGVPLVRIESEGARQVVVRVDEARVAYVHPGARVDVEIDGVASSPAGETPLIGVVTEVGRAPGADPHAFTVKVAVPQTVTARSGTFARVVFRGASRRALLVPAAAIRRFGQVSSVHVVQAGVARLRLIQAGRSSSEGVEILAGLEAGESVVTSPGVGLADGTRVAIREARPSPGGQR